MRIFKKRKLYIVKWTYIPCEKPFVELVKAIDKEHAWRKIKREHVYSISLVDIQEVVE